MPVHDGLSRIAISMRRDLDDLLVVSLEQAVAAPFASCRLSDAGARVIKLERPGGDFARRYDGFVRGLSSYFVWLNRGKESVQFDLKEPGDIQFLHAMLAKADVFIQNLSPGAATRAGIGSVELRQRYPRLITCDITGYGPSGPASHLKAYDLLVQAESGLAFMTGVPEKAGRVGVSVCDIATGMYAFQAILQALHVRDRTGAGGGVEVSLFNSMADWMNVPYLQHRYGDYKPKRTGLSHPTIAPYGAFHCSDGHLILISIQNEDEWRNLCSGVLRNPGIADDPRFRTNQDRVANRLAVDGLVQSTFSTMSRDQAVTLLESSRIAYGRLSTLDDLERHPQNRFVRVHTSAGTVDAIAPAVISAEDIGGDFGRVPDFAEHDAAVRDEFGGRTAVAAKGAFAKESVPPGVTRDGST
jgi:crotonobetainyl-CoA:carnitine CoA-transferase CaiB-like acyl-CoA transferase